MDEKKYVLFEWELVEGPAVEIIDADQQEASFVPTCFGSEQFAPVDQIC
jgi:hypothetical protein